MKTQLSLFATTLVLAALPAAHADLGDSPTSPMTSPAGGSCSTPQVNNITLSAYAPGCSADAGTDAATPGGLKPTKFQLDGSSNQVVLAAAPMRMPACASKCYKFAGGTPDSGQGNALLTALNQKTFYFDDLCPGCKAGKHKSGKKTVTRGARIDISMSCAKSKNFRVQSATLKAVPCTEEVMAEIEKNGVSKMANSVSRQTASIPTSGAGR